MGGAIGGYFELELQDKNLPSGMLALNSARNCLEYILKVRKYTRVYIPYYTCDVLLEPLDRLGLHYEFYDVDNKFEPIFDYTKVAPHEGFLYTNYFGLKDKFIQRLLPLVSNLILDNAQSFFSKPLNNIDTFYSPRKFVGVSDGGFLSINEKLNEYFEQDVSYERMTHLLKRIDLSAEDGYQDFCVNDQSLHDQPIRWMSRLTSKLLSGIDFKTIKQSRRENFLFLHQALSRDNILSLEMDEDAVPMVYPFRTKDKSLRGMLIKERIFCASYWPNVLNWSSRDSNAYQLTEEIIALPIDQRLTREELERMLTIIKL